MPSLLPVPPLPTLAAWPAMLFTVARLERSGSNACSAIGTGAQTRGVAGFRWRKRARNSLRFRVESLSDAKAATGVDLLKRSSRALEERLGERPLKPAIDGAFLSMARK
jgi:hypothetical protein